MSKIYTELGTILPRDEELAKRVKKTKSITDTFRVISNWEKESVKEFIKREQNSISGILNF